MSGVKCPQGLLCGTLGPQKVAVFLGGFQTRDLAGCGVIGMGLQGSRLPLLLACCLTVQSPSCRPPLLGPLLYSGPRWAVASQTPESQTLPATSPFCHSKERRNERNCKRTLGVQEDTLHARGRFLCKSTLTVQETLAVQENTRCMLFHTLLQGQQPWKRLSVTPIL